MLANKTYKPLSICVVEIDKADVVTTSAVTATWKTSWGDVWDDYNVKEDWQ